MVGKATQPKLQGCSLLFRHVLALNAYQIEPGWVNIKFQSKWHFCLTRACCGCHCFCWRWHESVETHVRCKSHASLTVPMMFADKPRRQCFALQTEFRRGMLAVQLQCIAMHCLALHCIRCFSLSDICLQCNGASCQLKYCFEDCSNAPTSALPLGKHISALSPACMLVAAQHCTVSSCNSIL